MIAQSLARMVRAAKVELAKERAYLLPLRLFIGAGWLRAAAEKMVDPGWWDGTELTVFLNAQLEWSQQAFPFYGALMESVLRPNAAVIGIVVIVLQLLAGVTIALGYYTNAGILIANLLNANFILAGVPDPSAFYVVIQLVLFYGGAGAVLGLDARADRRHHHPLLVSTVAHRPANLGPLRLVYAWLAEVYVVLAAAMAPFISSLEPEVVVEDPAVILVTLAVFAAAAAAIRSIGYGQQARSATSQHPDRAPTPTRA